MDCVFVGMYADAVAARYTDGAAEALVFQAGVGWVKPEDVEGLDPHSIVSLFRPAGCEWAPEGLVEILTTLSEGNRVDARRRGSRHKHEITGLMLAKVNGVERVHLSYVDANGAAGLALLEDFYVKVG